MHNISDKKEISDTDLFNINFIKKGKLNLIMVIKRNWSSIWK